MLWLTLRKLKSKNLSKQREAIINLSELNTSKANKALINVLNGQNYLLRKHAVRAIGSTHNYALIHLLPPLLRDKEPSMRLEAIYSLSDLWKHSIISQATNKRGTTQNLFFLDLFIGALKDEFYKVRRTAAEVLGDIGDLKALEPLIPLLTDIGGGSLEAQKAREPAEQALIKIVSKQRSSKKVRALVPSLVTLLFENNIAESAVLEVLSNIDDYQAFKVFLSKKYFYGNQCEKYIDEMSGCIPIANYAREALKDDNENVRKSAAVILATLGDLHAIESFLEGKDKFQREKAIEALVRLRKVETLIQALEVEDYDVRGKAAEALGSLGDTKAVEPLIQALKNPETATYSCAVALGRFGDKKAVFPVIDYLFSKYRKPENMQFEADTSSFQPLFGVETNHVLEAGSYFIKSKKTTGTSDPLTVFSYALNMDFVREICGTNTEISTFLLRKLANISDAEVVSQEDYMGERHKTLSFEPMRNLAQNELKRRY